MVREMVFGVHPVMEVLRCGRRRAHEFYCGRSPKDAGIRKILSLARAAGVKVQQVDKEKIETLAPRMSHQGVVLDVDRLETLSLDDALNDLPRSKETIWLALDEVTDPQNFGAILRNAACFGAAAVMVTDRRSAGLTPLVQKIASGAAEHVPVIEAGNLNQSIRKLKTKDFWVYGAAVEGAPITEVSVNGPAFLLIGSEGRGLRKKTRELSDELVAIPQAPGGVASLNASCACAVLLHEFRQRIQ
jgi:23S rRNA (guanosine2251-2'-O)-methyltransferase